jgi:putative transposase
MPFNPSIHKRRSIRLPGYDYTQPGAYFITIDTHQRTCLFGEIAHGGMRLNECGEIARAEWLKTAEIRREIELDEFIVMPNHFHAIITIMECGNGFVGAQRRCAPTHTPKSNVIPKSIGAIVRAYKSAVTYRINRIRRTPGTPVWQRNYWEHIIRDEHDLSRIREYIRNNPAQWETDMENGGHPGRGGWPV